mgnify:CR=1 FL=1
MKLLNFDYLPCADAIVNVRYSYAGIMQGTAEMPVYGNVVRVIEKQI